MGASRVLFKSYTEIQDTISKLQQTKQDQTRQEREKVQSIIAKRQFWTKGSAVNNLLGGSIQLLLGAGSKFIKNDAVSKIMETASTVVPFIGRSADKYIESKDIQPQFEQNIHLQDKQRKDQEKQTLNQLLREMGNAVTQAKQKETESTRQSTQI